MVASLVLGFSDAGGRDAALRLGGLVVGLLLLWAATNSERVDRAIKSLMRKAIAGWTDVEVRDYVQLLDVSGDYAVRASRSTRATGSPAPTCAGSTCRQRGSWCWASVVPTGATSGRPHRTARSTPATPWCSTDARAASMSSRTGRTVRPATPSTAGRRPPGPRAGRGAGP